MRRKSTAPSAGTDPGERSVTFQLDVEVNRIPMTILTNASGATFSACRCWRYLLWRRWDAEKPVANFLMLNPSTADEHQLDPSCTRARDFAERWGYGALIVTNLFAWRATDPDDMKRAADPVGRSNNQAILRSARRSGVVVCAWGNHGSHLGRAATVGADLRRAGVPLHALRITAEGQPSHPLYLRGSLRPVPWK